jgi:hypothetical protein
MTDDRFRSGAMPNFRDVFEQKARMCAKTLEMYEFQPRLDDSGDDLESAIGQLHDLWRMWIDNDIPDDDVTPGDDAYTKWWESFFNALEKHDYSLIDIYADDIRYEYAAERYGV